jgi:hypothetical protein
LRRKVLSDSTASRMNTHSTTANRFTSSSLSQDDKYQCGTSQKSIDFDDACMNNECSATFRHRSSSVPRRQSFSGSGLISLSAVVNSNSTATPIRDRRAVLEAWRKARCGETSNTGNVEDLSSIETRKRTRGDPLLLPPSSKHYRTNMSHDYACTSFGQSLHQNSHPRAAETQYQNSILSSNLTIDYCDNDIENRSAFTARTPSSRRGTMGSARRKSLMGRNIYHVNEGPWNGWKSRLVVVPLSSLDILCFLT